MNKKSMKTIVRKFTVDKYQSAVSMFVGSTAEGLPLQSITRRGNKVTCVYGKNK